LSSSVNIDLLGVYLRRHGLLSGVRVEIQKGNYDDPLGDFERFSRSGVEQAVFLPFFDNLMPSFETQLGRMSSDVIDSKKNEIRDRYRLVFEKAQALRLVFVGTFHRLGLPGKFSGDDVVSQVLSRFNQVLREEASAFSNIIIIDTEELIRLLGLGSTFDMRFYFQSKTPYTSMFMDELARRIKLESRNFGTTFYKALMLDCDNTLWGGILGEDLITGIKLDPYDYPGNIFWSVQHCFADLERNGVLLGLVSKNNSGDVDEVLANHPNMVLRDKQFIIKKVNWNDKISNLQSIATELNIGLDSIVFLDDDPLECDAVQKQLPMVKTVQVPKLHSSYPLVAQQISQLFLAGKIGTGESNKTEEYRHRAKVQHEQSQFSSQGAYLSSLNLAVELLRNAADRIPRISELSMKSNQFNLTTIRYTVTEITTFMHDTSHAVYSLVVSDKFGNSGLTGVVVMHYLDHVALVDNFFMSCRVIGRGVEMSIWDHIASDAKAHGCTELGAQFIPSPKNALVANFYDRLGLNLVNETEAGIREYRTGIDEFVAPKTPWVRVDYGR
jgi:FkbH-like protein